MSYTVKVCQEYFDFGLPTNTIEQQRKTFLARLDTLRYSLLVKI